MVENWMIIKTMALASAIENATLARPGLTLFTAKLINAVIAAASIKLTSMRSINGRANI